MISHHVTKTCRCLKWPGCPQEKSRIPSERTSKTMGRNVENDSIDEHGAEISWVKGVQITRSGGTPSDHSGCRLSPGGECFTPWLEELVSKSNTIQTQEDISVAGKIAGNTKPKLCVYLCWFFINISGLVNSFGTSSCLARDIISLHPWIAAGSSRKSIWESLRWDKELWVWWKW